MNCCLSLTGMAYVLPYISFSVLAQLLKGKQVEASHRDIHWHSLLYTLEVCLLVIIWGGCWLQYLVPTCGSSYLYKPIPLLHVLFC